MAQNPLPIVDLSSLKYGLKDSITNAVLLPAKYDYIAYFHQQYAVVRNEGRYGVIDPSGKEILPLQYHKIQRLSQGVYLIQKNDLFGLLDHHLQTLLPMVFAKLQVVDSFAIIQNGTHYGLIDWEGNICLPFEFDELLLEQDKYGNPALIPNRIRVRKGEQMGVRTLKNEVVIPFDFQWQQIDYWNDTLLLVENKEGQQGVLNHVLDTMIPFGYYEQIHTLFAGHVAVKKQGKYGYLNHKLKVKIPFFYDQALDFQGDLTTCQTSGKWGVINQRQDTIISFDYDAPVIFKNGCARLYREKSGKWALVNTTGNLITPFKYDDLVIKDACVFVKQEQLWGAINPNGLPLLRMDYDEIFLKRGYIVVVQNHRQGLFQLTGEEILKPEYEFIYPTWNDSLIMVRKDGRYGFVNQKGNVVIPIQYENARNFKWGRASVLYKGGAYEIDREGKKFGHFNK
jgi:hypothetical protein